KRFQKNALPDDIPDVTVTIDEDTVFVTNMLKEAGLVASTSEAMRMIKQGAVKINGEEKVTDSKLEIAKGSTAIYQVGKRKFANITVA
ncbi:MAG: S4 domain-containing protein, partial [Pseudoalteromonas sp.]